jgi:hypothetical protein
MNLGDDKFSFTFTSTNLAISTNTNFFTNHFSDANCIRTNIMQHVGKPNIFRILFFTALALTP